MCVLPPGKRQDLFKSELIPKVISEIEIKTQGGGTRDWMNVRVCENRNIRLYVGMRACVRVSKGLWLKMDFTVTT